jgi:hypothetical protein
MWLSWDQIDKKSQSKNIVCWGCYEYFDKTATQINSNIDFIVDININIQGKQKYAGLDVFDPRILFAEPLNRKKFIIITSTAFLEISESLVENNYIPGEDFCVSPVLKNQSVLSKMFGLEGRLLFSSSDSLKDSEISGGGLYEIDIKSGVYKKVLSGITRGFARIDNQRLIVADAGVGLRILDNSYNEINRIKLGDDAYPHGLCVDHGSNHVYVVLTRFDQVVSYDLTEFHPGNFYNISSKSSSEGSRHYYHHANDLEIFNGSLYVSMFSLSGNTNFEWDDGGVIEYSLSTGDKVGTLISGLWRPHSIKKLVNGKLAVLNSMRGELLVGSQKVMTSLNGFVRGLDFQDGFYYIGQSTHRYFDRMKNQSGNISLDCGIFIYDEETSATRFLATPTIRDINTLKLIDLE